MNSGERPEEQFVIQLGNQYYTSELSDQQLTAQLCERRMQLMAGERPVKGVEGYFAFSEPYATQDDKQRLHIKGNVYLESGTFGIFNLDAITMLRKKFKQVQEDENLAEETGFSLHPIDDTETIWRATSDAPNLQVLLRLNDARGSITIENQAYTEDSGCDNFLAPDMEATHPLAAVTAFLRVQAFVLDEVSRNYNVLLERKVQRIGNISLLNVGAVEEAETAETDKAVSSAFDRLGGLRHEKAELQQIVYLHQNPEIASRWNKQAPHSLLLYGPPGTGKTSLVKALAEDLGAHIIEVNSEDVIDMWVGNSGKNLAQKFTEAKNHDGKVVLFFDEIDSIVPGQRDDAPHNKQVLGVFKKLAEDIALNYPDVILAATTNTPNLDPAITRRFELQFNVGAPTSADRAEIITTLLSDIAIAQGLQELNAQDIDIVNQAQATNTELVDIQVLAQKAEDLSGDDLTKIFDAVCRRKMMEEVTSGHASPLRQSEILAEIQEFKNNRIR